MKMAVLNGLAHTTEEVINQTSYSCATGNCTWNPFESLAVCNRCNDLQGQLTRYSNRTALINILNNDDSKSAFENGTTFRTNNNLIINNADNISYISPTGTTAPLSIIYMTAYGTGNASATASFKDNDVLIWSTSILRLRTIHESDLRWPDLPIEAIECALYYCVKQYNASVHNGVFYENEATLQNVRRSPDSWQLQPIRYLGSPYFFQFINTTEGRSLEYNNRTAGLYWSDLILESDSGSKYNVSQQGVHGTSAYLQNTFRYKIDINRFNDTFGDRFTTGLDLSGVLNGWALSFGNVTQYSPTIIETIWQSQNISATFDAVARSMSNAIRASEYSLRDTNSTSVHKGVAQVVVIFYSVQWRWIILHAALVLAGLIFLAITIWKTINLGIPAWKSHSLPPLAFSYQVDSLFSSADSVEIMEQRAAKHHVRFAANTKDVTFLTERATNSDQHPSQQSLPL